MGNSKEAKRKQIITQMGCQFRFHKCIQEIKKIISSNKIGRTISVIVECGSYLPDWHPDEDFRKSYAARTELGGGVVLTNIHEIDYLYWLLGDVKEVFSVTGRFSDLKISADDLSASILKFRNNTICELHLDYFQKPDFRSCKIIGTKGTIFWDSNSNEICLYNNLKKKWISKFKYKNFQRNKQFVDELQYFLNCIKNKKQTINPINDTGLEPLKISLAAKKSSLLKRTVVMKK